MRVLGSLLNDAIEQGECDRRDSLYLSGDGGVVVDNDLVLWVVCW